ncbi:Membrane protein insertase YidC [Neochlamydia sp. AcF95]|nr:Membrane protein insertase YidC [Neochlamydia sp. AcF95]
MFKLQQKSLLMDKRTALFVLCLTLTLFAVNWYFEGKNQESLKEWTAQQKAKALQIEQQLEKEISQKTENPSNLPLIDLYADENATNFLTTGVEINHVVMLLAWDEQLPKIVYSKKFQENNKSQAFNLLFKEGSIGQPAIYAAENGKKLQVSELPDFGSFDLQIVEVSGKNQHAITAPKILWGEYKDGRLSIPLVRLALLKQKEQRYENQVRNYLPSNAIALLKTAAGYLPVGIYEQEDGSLKLMNEFMGTENIISMPKAKQTSSSLQKAEEKFFVLENAYQQLVFSNQGGSIVEINLPFQSASHPATVVKEIEYDRDMVKNHPSNAHFPAHPYYTPDGALHQKGSLGGYYPLLRRDLIAEGEKKPTRLPPRFYATNIVSEYPEFAELTYEVKKFDSHTIVFEASQSHRTITKTYTLRNDEQTAPYTFDLTIEIKGDSRGLWLTSGVPEVEWISGSPAPALKYRITRNRKSSVENIDLPKDALTVSSVYIDWIVDSNGFFGIILDPLSKIDAGYRVQQVPGTIVPSRLVQLDQQYDRFKAVNMPGYMALLPLASDGGSMNFRIFSGPFAESILKKVDAMYSDSTTGYNPDYIASQTFHGWFAFISEPFAKFLFILMKFFYRLTSSWAFSIILLTIALRIMMYPLNAWSTKSMLRMQQIAPEVTALQEKYKKDPKKAQLEIMSLYRERGVNPISGCFPLLIQMPFLIGMFDLLKSTFELRGASFIPGWIDNLTAPDVLFSWDTPLFFIGNQFHLLPILLGGVMFIQQRYMTTGPKDPSQMTEQQRQQRSMSTIMTGVFAVMFYNFPSGLNLYWLSSMLLGILQQGWTLKQLQKKALRPQVIEVSQKIVKK